MGILSKCVFARARSTGVASLHIARHKTGGRTRGRVAGGTARHTGTPKPKRIKLRVSQHSLTPGSAVEEPSRQTRPFRVKSTPRYGIAGEGMAPSEEQVSILGSDAFRAFLFLGVFPLFGLAALVFFNDDLRTQYLDRWDQNSGKNRVASSQSLASTEEGAGGT